MTVLIHEDSVYGKTFSDWTGFFAIEGGTQLFDVVKFEPGRGALSSIVTRALEGDPEYVIRAAFPSDAAESRYLLDELGDAEEAIDAILNGGPPEPRVSVADLYERVYERVAASHVRIKNQRNFGDTYDTYMSDFVAPYDSPDARDHE